MCYSLLSPLSRLSVTCLLAQSVFFVADTLALCLALLRNREGSKPLRRLPPLESEKRERLTTTSHISSHIWRAISEPGQLRTGASPLSSRLSSIPQLDLVISRLAYPRCDEKIIFERLPPLLMQTMRPCHVIVCLRACARKPPFPSGHTTVAGPARLYRIVFCLYRISAATNRVRSLLCRYLWDIIGAGSVNIFAGCRHKYLNPKESLLLALLSPRFVSHLPLLLHTHYIHLSLSPASRFSSLLSIPRFPGANFPRAHSSRVDSVLVSLLLDPPNPLVRYIRGTVAARVRVASRFSRL